MTTALLERSGSVPIIVAFMSPDPITPVPSTEVLLPHFSRIQKVHIQASPEQLMGFLSNLCGHSSILEAVELQCGLTGDQHSEVGGGRGVAKDRVFKLPPSKCFLELNHLTHLELSYTRAWGRDYRTLMSANPTLEVVIIRGTGGWEECVTLPGASPFLSPTFGGWSFTTLL